MSESLNAMADIKYEGLGVWLLKNKNENEIERVRN